MTCLELLRESVTATSQTRDLLMADPTPNSALGVSHVMRYINLRYLLTYLTTIPSPPSKLHHQANEHSTVKFVFFSCHLCNEFRNLGDVAKIMGHKYSKSHAIFSVYYLVQLAKTH